MIGQTILEGGREGGREGGTYTYKYDSIRNCCVRSKINLVYCTLNHAAQNEKQFSKECF